MQELSFISLLGHSICSKALVSFIAKHKINQELRIEKNVDGHIYEADSWRVGEEISLTFIGNQLYSNSYGTAIGISDKENDELILTQITVDTEFSKTEKKSPIVLPFQLQLGETKETILNKLKKKPKSKSTFDYGHAWWFTFDRFKILTALNDQYELIWLRAALRDQYEIEKERLKKELKEQRTNIKAENIDGVLEFKNELPTIKWRQRKLEGDTIFTDESIKSIENILLDYIGQLVELIRKKNATAIYNSVKRVTHKINKVHAEDEVIDTLEREELCEFINRLVRKTGLDMEPTADLTEDWRDW